MNRFHNTPFEDGIKMMRRLVVDQSVNVVSTIITKPTSTLNGF